MRKEDLILMKEYIEDTVCIIEGEFGMGRSFKEVWEYDAEDSDAIDVEIKELYLKITKEIDRG